jgi:PLAT/LH2 domain
VSKPQRVNVGQIVTEVNLMAEIYRRSKPEGVRPIDVPNTSGHRGDVMAAVQGAVSAAATVYQVAVFTGDVNYAGTDGDVWIWIDGTKGRSQWRYIDNAEDNFERNKTDYFYLNLPDLGALTAAWIYFRPQGSNSAWFLNTVVVNGKTYAYYNWIVSEGMYRLTST